MTCLTSHQHERLLKPTVWFRRQIFVCWMYHCGQDIPVEMMQGHLACSFDGRQVDGIRDGRLQISEHAMVALSIMLMPLGGTERQDFSSRLLWADRGE